MIPIHVLGKQSSLFNRFMSELRDSVIQKDRMRFRKNLERTGEIMAYEISKTFPYVTKDVETPLGTVSCNLPAEEPVLACVLRAGLPLHKGLQNYFDHADNAFISAYRKHSTPEIFDIEIEYLASPPLENRILILADPMLATGASMVLAHRAFLQRGNPSHTHIVSVIASTYGIEYVKKHMPPNTTLWIGDIDDELTAQGYIVPGLGDAGDLAFGEKM